MRTPARLLQLTRLVGLLATMPVLATDDPGTWLQTWRTNNPTWRGVHMCASSEHAARELLGALPRFASNGVNVLIVEVNYAFEFSSHPELRGGSFVTRERARELGAKARELGIRLIPELNCLGHQSWSRTTLPLLARMPQFDETPTQFPGNTNIYCRSWCPQHPDVNKVVFALIDDLISGFGADAFHVGMDEVFLIASPHCGRCKGGDPARLFAKAVNDLHGHITGEKRLEMLMWGDRLLDAKALGYSEWEAARNGTQAAVDLIPKDIVICDWHYGSRTDYPSVPLLLQKGFRVWPSGWQPLEATLAFSRFAREQRKTCDQVLGYLCTTWGKVQPAAAPEWAPIVEPLAAWQ